MSKVTAPWWRCVLMSAAFNLRNTRFKPLANILWYLSRLWATEKTHMALSAFFTGLMMGAISKGEE